MGQRLPQRVCYSLPELEALWGVSEYEIKQWLVHGELAASVWLPFMVFHEVREQDEGGCLILTRELVHREGYTCLFAHQCRGLFAKGELCLREFPNEKGDGRYALPETADCFCVTLSEMVILHKDRLRFEKKHDMEMAPERRKDFRAESTTENEFDPTFKVIWHQGQRYSFGDMQAKIIRLLYQAAEEGKPWQKGKPILGKAESESYTLSSVFSHHPAWGKNFIETDKDGTYRLSQALLRSIRQSKGY